MLRIILALCFFLLPVFSFSAEIQRLCIKNTCLGIQVAASDQVRQKGLMFRRKLKTQTGMLFIFQKEDFYSFWMKNMNFPLDLIWANKEKVIVDLTQNVEPCDDSCASISPKEKVLYVLEVNAGFIQKHKVKIGEKLEF